MFQTSRSCVDIFGTCYFFYIFVADYTPSTLGITDGEHVFFWIGT